VVRNAEEKIPLARPTLRWKDNIKMNSNMLESCGIAQEDSRHGLLSTK
jgi:hypothetical protein